MGFFSRKKEVVAPARGAEVAFETLRRSPRNSRKPRVAVGSLGEDGDSGVPLDPAQVTKTRARRRLIGAVALGLAAIVFVPMLFDRTPVAPPDDIALQIPDKDSPFAGRRGLPEPAKGPLKPSSDLPTVSSGTTGAAEAQPSPPAAGSGRGPDGDGAATAAPPLKTPSKAPEGGAPKTADKVAEKTAEKPADKTAEKPADKSASPEKPADRSAAKTADAARAAEKAAEKSRPSSVGSNDDPRALAALEGRAEAPAGAAAAAVDAAGAKSYAVQIAAFSAPDKARGLRDQLTANGLKSYTESVSTNQGLRTRVRLGPFPSRDAADRARQKLKTMKLDGSVVPL